MLSNLRIQKSDLAEISTIKKYLDQIANVLGNTTGDDASKDSVMIMQQAMHNFYNALADLNNNPEYPSRREGVIVAAKYLSDTISNNVSQIQQIRLSVDQDIMNQVNKANNIIQSIADNNALLTSTNPEIKANAENSLVTYTNQLSEIMNINVYRNTEYGRVTITTSSGLALINNSANILSYNNVTDVGIFLNNIPLASLDLNYPDRNGNLVSMSELISGGAEGNIKTILSSGKLYGLQQLRDVAIPQLIEKIDSFANNLSYQMNEIHNSGAGLSPSSSLLGKTLVGAPDKRDWSGSVRINIVDPNGNYVKRHEEGSQGKQRDLRPLELNLSALNGGSGPGIALSTSIIEKEINEYFYSAPLTARVRMGDLISSPDGTGDGGIEDIKLVSMQSSISGGQFAFDFELDNGHRNNYHFQVLNLSVSNGATVVTTSQNAYTSVAGTRTRTNQQNVIDLSTGGGGTYVITARLKVVDNVTGEISIADVEYQVNDSANDVLNTRYSAISASGANTVVGTYGAVLVPASTVKSFMSANIVNSSGYQIASNLDGFLQLKTTDSSLYRVVIDDLDSKENGLSTNASFVSTNKGFSHYFGLNNFFVENPTIRGSAYNMAVRSDIVANGGYNLFSVGKMELSAPTKDVISTQGMGVASGTFELVNLPNYDDTLTINGQVFTFDNAGATDTTIDISSANIPTIITKIIAKLNTVNSTNTNAGINFAHFMVQPLNSNKMVMTANVAGIAANSMSIAANLTIGTTGPGGITRTALINTTNTTLASSAPSGNLIGGTNNDSQALQNNIYTYSVRQTDKTIADAMYEMQNTTYTFASTTSFAAQNTTFNQFMQQDIISYFVDNVSNAAMNLDNTNAKYQQFNLVFQNQTKVNLDEQLAMMVQIQASYNASATIIRSVQKMWDSLFASV